MRRKHSLAHGKPGVTLVEVMLTTAILAILLTVILVFLDPFGRLSNAQQAQTETNVRSIEQAMELYALDRMQDPAEGKIPLKYEHRKSICTYGLPQEQIGSGQDQVDCIVLDELVDLGYLSSLPIMAPFPEGVDTRTLGFTVYRDGRSNLVGPPQLPHALAFVHPDSMISVDDEDWPPHERGFHIDQDMPFSIVIWFKPFENTAFHNKERILLQKRTVDLSVPALIGYAFYIYQAVSSEGQVFSPQIIFQIAQTPSRFIAIPRILNADNGASPYGHYHMMAITYDGSGLAAVPAGSTSVPSLKGSLNGGTLYAASTTASSSITEGSVASDEPMQIGGDGATPFDGLIDDIKIYDRPLSQAEVVSLYNKNRVEDGLVNHWTFDEGEGNTVYERMAQVYTSVVSPEWSDDVVLPRYPDH